MRYTPTPIAAALALALLGSTAVAQQREINLTVAAGQALRALPPLQL
jgi:hypothetical protein